MPSKTALRKRWKEQEFLAGTLSAVEAFRSGENREGLDLRGANVGMDGPLATFGLTAGSFEGVDLSFGRGALIISDAQVRGLHLDQFAFDRASYIIKSRLLDSFFRGFTGRFDVSDTHFTSVDFSASSFSGGFNEYGFKRCRFESCTFDEIDWKNTYFRACRFEECSFENAVIRSSILAGVKIVGAGSHPELIDSDGTISVETSSGS